MSILQLDLCLADEIRSPARIAADAYSRAVDYFERELAEKQSERAWIRGQTSLEDVRSTVEQARNAYVDRSEHHTRARKWIDAFAANIGRYGTVLDILANADPLHAGLVWGAIKFVFAVRQRAVMRERETVLIIPRVFRTIRSTLQSLQRPLPALAKSCRGFRSN